MFSLNIPPFSILMCGVDLSTVPGRSEIERVTPFGGDLKDSKAWIGRDVLSCDVSRSNLTKARQPTGIQFDGGSAEQSRQVFEQGWRTVVMRSASL
jgi:hypothetical protein